ncbi:hypothetical protein KIW84_062130 [Lathyrus oleraceus]|uniref:Uncharacterized protein n=1 Tax=Pisum sativum TaxID=3888 RepID=A0A9D5A374_PEA|nr:hypothetical protein KIW84_062126 [Pisum sativum]KAI5395827.1 hypothetical protein KIW84_062130 [Pisum sativum]
MRQRSAAQTEEYHGFQQKQDNQCQQQVVGFLATCLNYEQTVPFHRKHHLHSENCKSDFVIYKLKQMGKITEIDILQISKQFDSLNHGIYGKITLADLMETV